MPTGPATTSGVINSPLVVAQAAVVGEVALKLVGVADRVVVHLGRSL